MIKGFTLRLKINRELNRIDFGVNFLKIYRTGLSVSYFFPRLEVHTVKPLWFSI